MSPMDEGRWLNYANFCLSNQMQTKGEEWLHKVAKL
jgi:hypothetical protein